MNLKLKKHRKDREKVLNWKKIYIYIYIYIEGNNTSLETTTTCASLRGIHGRLNPILFY